MSNTTHEIDLCSMRENLYTGKFSGVLNLIHPKICTFKVSNIFLDCQVLICDFHREQAWERWLNVTKNGTRMVKDIMLCKFWRIARARTADELQQAIIDLKNCEYWKGG